MVGCFHKSESVVSVSKFSVHLPIGETCRKVRQKVVTDGKPLEYTVKDFHQKVFLLR